MLEQNIESIQELNKFIYYQKQHSTSIIEEADEGSSDSSKGFFRPTDINTPEVS